MVFSKISSSTNKVAGAVVIVQSLLPSWCVDLRANGVALERRGEKSETKRRCVVLFPVATPFNEPSSSTAR